MSRKSVVGIFLIRNEDVFIEQAIRNVYGFCDRIIIADNYSTDRTWQIVNNLPDPDGKYELFRVRRPGDSHDLVKDLAGTNSWVFGVDGDELYDPAGLEIFRADLDAGKYDDWWVVFGNVLNAVSIDYCKKTARGYLAPPCRSMTKLYNFGLLDSWEGKCVERMLGGEPVFKAGAGEGLRLDLYKQVEWHDARFRCIHTCFMARSSAPGGLSADGKTRRNPVEIAAGGWLGRLGLWRLVRKDRQAPDDWKLEKYMRGELVEVDVMNFLTGEPLAQAR